MKRVLVLGAGLVVKPLLDDLLSLPEVEVRLAALNVSRAQKLLAGRPQSSALEVNARDEAQLLPEVKEASVVISMLPAGQHVGIAGACLSHRVPLITTSYVSPEMRKLNEEARKQGVLLLNECGLDPGIDHMTAVQVIRRVQREGGRVLSFASYCGGLPAPEANTNPWGYKFAWNPRGVVMAARNPVGFLKDGKRVYRNFPDLFSKPYEIAFPGIGRLEAYPNRDCLRYIEAYGLTGAKDFYRGTLRYPGWCETWHALFRLGLLELQPRDWTGSTYAEFLSHHVTGREGGLVDRLARTLGVEPDHEVIARLEWLGLLSDRPVPEGCASPLDVISNRLERKLRYSEGERDMVLLEHNAIVVRADGRLRRIVKHVRLFGAAGDVSAMARAVGYPAAIACRLLLEGRVRLAGVRIPVDLELTEPILLGLARRGIPVEEREEDLPAGHPAP